VVKPEHIVERPFGVCFRAIRARKQLKSTSNSIDLGIGQLVVHKHFHIHVASPFIRPPGTTIASVLRMNGTMP
jgi:hypothetical protein